MQAAGGPLQVRAGGQGWADLLGVRSKVAPRSGLLQGSLPGALAQPSPTPSGFPLAHSRPAGFGLGGFTVPVPPVFTSAASVR